MSFFSKSLITATVALACFGAASAETCTGDSAKLAAMETVIAALNSKDLSMLDGIAVSEFKRVAPDQSVQSLSDWKIMYTQIFDAFPDFKISNDSMAADCSSGFIRWTATGTNSGDSVQAASGRKIRNEGVANFLFNDEGKITHELVFFDTAQMARQLDAEELPYVSN